MSEQLVMSDEQVGVVEHARKPRNYGRLAKVGAAAAGALLAVPVLAACGDSSAETAGKAHTQIVTYHDRDLSCRVIPESYDYYSYDCDFDGYYQDSSYDAPSSITRIKPGTLTEVTVPYNGGELTCLVYPEDHGYNDETCDFAGFRNGQRN